MTAQSGPARGTPGTGSREVAYAVPRLLTRKLARAIRPALAAPPPEPTLAAALAMEDRGELLGVVLQVPREPYGALSQPRKGPGEAASAARITLHAFGGIAELRNRGTHSGLSLDGWAAYESGAKLYALEALAEGQVADAAQRTLAAFLALEETRAKAWWEREEAPPRPGPEAGEDSRTEEGVPEAAASAERQPGKEEALAGAPEQ